jgi:dihydrofolate reductase
MTRVRVACFTISLDGFGAGPAQSVDNPLGVGGERLHEWMFRTPTGRAMLGEGGGEPGVDEDFVAAADQGVGATVMGRNMFTPERGGWDDDEWRGWWGDDPPFHHPVFVLTHHPREPIEMAGGTTFHFVTDGIEAALDRAAGAACGRDVRIGGGVSTVRAALRARLVDELHVVIAPVLLGSGEHLLGGLDLPAAGYEVAEHRTSPGVTHVRLARR